MYRVRKCYVPRDEVGDVLRVVLGVILGMNFSVIRIKMEVECEVMENVLSI